MPSQLLHKTDLEEDLTHTQRKWCEDGAEGGLKMPALKKGAMLSSTKDSSSNTRSWKRQKADSPWSFCKALQPCQHLDLAQRSWFWTSGPQYWERIHLLFEAAKLVVIWYSSFEKLTQTLMFIECYRGPVPLRKTSHLIPGKTEYHYDYMDEKIAAQKG